MLKRLQKLLGIDVAHYLRGGGFLMTAQWLLFAFHFVSTWFFTNYVDKEIYGSYGYVQALLAMLVITTFQGYHVAVNRGAARGFDGVLIASVLKRMKFSLVGSLIMAGVGVYYFAVGDRELAIGCLIGGTMLGTVFALDDFGSFLTGKKKYGIYAVCSIAIEVTAAGATIASILLSGQFLVILTANLLARSIGNLVCTVIIYRRRQGDEIDPDFDKFGRRQTGINALGAVAYHLDQVIVGALFPMAVMADFKLASSLTNPIRNVGTMIFQLIFPKMVRREGRAFAVKTLSKGMLLFALMLAVGAAMFGALVLVMPWLFPKYAATSTPYIFWMIVSAVVGVMVIYFEAYYLSQDSLHRVYYGVSVARPVLTIVLIPVLVQFFGVFGAIYAKLVARTLETAYLMVRIFAGWDDYPQQENPQP